MAIDLIACSDAEVRGYLIKAVAISKKKNSGIVTAEDYLDLLLQDKQSLLMKILSHFNLDGNQIKALINKNGLKDYPSSLNSGETISAGGVVFDTSILEILAEAYNHVRKDNTMEGEISLNSVVLSLCTCPASRLKSYLEANGIEEQVIKEFIFQQTNDLVDGITSLKKEDEIRGDGGSNSGTDTLEPPKDGKRTSAVPKSSSRSVLSFFGKNLIDDVRDGKIDKVTGRDEEIRTVQEILCRKQKRNALLLGDPGVGKTAIVEGLAIEMFHGRVPLPLKGKELWSLDVTNMVAGTRYRGDFEERIKALINELKKDQNVILFIDEIHQIMGAGGNLGSGDLGNILKPELARGEIQVIGATTQDEYQKYIMRDGALERRFQTLQVDEPNEDVAVEILEGIKDSYSKFHGVEYTPEALQAAVRYSKQYIPSRFLPDKSIDLIDQAGARSQMRTSNVPQDIVDMRNHLDEIRSKKIQASRSTTSSVRAKAKIYHEQEVKLERLLMEREDRFYQDLESDTTPITEKDIADVVSSLTKIPTDKITLDDSLKLLDLEMTIKKHLVCQNEALQTVCQSIRRSRTGFKDPKKPIGSFLFMGPTGVGKTELARQLALELFGKEDNLIRFDMSEYTERFDVSKLLGAAPGFVGYEEGGKLTEAVRKQPYSILLFDEVEKAHKDIFNVFLQILEEGQVTDAKGRKVFFNNTIIILTSNIGADKAYNMKSMGFGNQSDKAKLEQIRSTMKKEAELYFRPEFLNRLDDMVIFNALDKESLRIIVDLQMEKINQRMKAQHGLELQITDVMRDQIIEKGHTPKYGARPINRTIQSLIGDYVTNLILKKEIKEGTMIQLTWDNEKVCHQILSGGDKKEEAHPIETVDDLLRNLF